MLMHEYFRVLVDVSVNDFNFTCFEITLYTQVKLINGAFHIKTNESGDVYIGQLKQLEEVNLYYL